MQQVNVKTLRADFLNPRARMLPLWREQVKVYRLADKNPPGLEGYQPRWEVINGVLLAQQSLTVKVDLMTDFHLLAILASGTVNNLGGFRVKLYDAIKQRNLMERPVQVGNLGGAAGAPFFLTDPYSFDQPRSQLLAILQNLETATNTVQLALYGLSAPFQGRLSNEY